MLLVVDGSEFPIEHSITGHDLAPYPRRASAQLPLCHGLMHHSLPRNLSNKFGCC